VHADKYQGKSGSGSGGKWNRKRKQRGRRVEGMGGRRGGAKGRNVGGREWIARMGKQGEPKHK
jgi:hypothetical protein